MKTTRHTTVRYDKVMRMLERFAIGDYSYREPCNPEGNELDEIVCRLNNLGEQISKSGQAVTNYQKRVSALMDILLKYTFFDFSEKAEVSEAGDELDAVAYALNTLGEELRDRIEAEKKYRERLEQMAVVMETTIDAVIILDEEGNIRNWNRSAETLFGENLRTSRGNEFFRIFSDYRSAGEIAGLIGRVRNGEQVVGHNLSFTRNDDRLFDLSLTLTPIKNEENRLRNMSAILSDITERKTAERELRVSEERFRRLIEGVKDYAIFMLDTAGLISSWNSGARALHGFSESEVMGQHFSIFYTPADRTMHLPAQMLKEAIQFGKTSRDVLLQRKDNSTFWANFLLTLLEDDQHNTNGFTVIIRDLTESKKKDEEIKSYTFRLEQKNKELERINKELSSFTYISNHDLQEPLRKIQTLASRIMETELSSLTDAGRDYFLRMDSCARRMQQLLRDVIDYTNLASSDEPCQDCDLVILVKQVLENLREEIEKKDASVEIKKLCGAYLVPSQFRRLLANLIGNSLKFSSPKRKPHITISSRIVLAPIPHYESASDYSEYCLIEVKDNGIGFEKQFNKKVFEVFQRLHSREEYPGTGIGLAICKKIVENHHGIIEAISELDAGTTIRVYLPLKKQD